MSTHVNAQLALTNALNRVEPDMACVWMNGVHRMMMLDMDQRIVKAERIL